MQKFICFILLFNSLVCHTQIVNYVNNPSFEIDILSYPSAGLFNGAKFWGGIDSTSCASYYLMGTPPIGTVPYGNFGFQFPRSGNNFLESSFYCNTCPRWYPRNRLKNNLIAGKLYCAKYHIVNTNFNRIAIDSYGIYFGDSSLDTITKCSIPLTYLNPQVVNQNGIITDTLNWIPISGTFVASGNEKYMVIGNFKSNAATNTLLLNPTLTVMGNDIYIDDVSLIEMELPAFAGRDTAIAPGDSIFLGREPDVGIDEACMWYKLPTIITPTTPALDTIAGFWIKPVSNSTFVVRQQLWCSGVKWDTVVIHLNPVGFEKLKLISDELKLFPIPTQDELQLSIYNVEYFKEFQTISIHNNLGVLIREEEINSNKIENKTITIKTDDLPSGVYSLQLKTHSNETISKRFVITR